MIFFLDENFPKRAASLLKERGHSVFDIRETGKEGLPDGEIFRLAQEKHAVFLTTDKDFYHTYHLTEKPHYGMIVIALRQPNSASITAKLIGMLDSSISTSFENKCILVTDNKSYIF
jgi:predicted nuclease of predicted toxin-antitoxin system